MRRNSYTSLLVSRANLRSMSAPALAWMRWSQWTVRGHGDLREAGGHELEQRHLRGGVLHGDAVGVEVVVGAAALELLALRIGEVVDEDLLGEREGSPEASPAQRGALGQGGVDLFDQLDRRACGDGHV